MNHLFNFRFIRNVTVSSAFERPFGIRYRDRIKQINIYLTKNEIITINVKTLKLNTPYI